MCRAPKISMAPAPPPPQPAKTPTVLDVAANRRLGAMLGYNGKNITLLSGGALDLMPKTDRRKTLLGGGQ